MSIVIEDSTVREIIAIVGTVGGGISVTVGYLVKKGYVDIWLNKLFVPNEVIHAVRNNFV